MGGGRLFRLVSYELDVAQVDLRGRVVLDAGCGSGMYSMIFAVLGASKVVGMDLFPANVTAINAIASEFHLPIEASSGDISRTGLPSGSVDFVYCVEAISHFEDWQAFAREAARVLRPGGKIVIGDGNNGANPMIVQGIHSFWERSERGPFTSEQFPPGDNLPFLYRRWMIIRREFPALSDEDVFQLGMRTTGVGGRALREACSRFVATGELPTGSYRRGMSQSRPEDAQRNEEPLNPLVIAGYLQTLGMRASARPHFGFGRSPLLPVLNEIGAKLSSIFLLAASRYLIIAEKRREAGVAGSVTTSSGNAAR